MAYVVKVFPFEREYIILAQVQWLVNAKYQKTPVVGAGIITGWDSLASRGGGDAEPVKARRIPAIGQEQWEGEV